MKLSGVPMAKEAVTSELMDEARDRALRLAVDTAGIGIWRYDVLADNMQIDHVVRDIYGMHLNTHVGIQTFRDLIHPQDKDHTRAVFDQALVDPKMNDYDLIYRINRKRNGSHVWLQVHARVLWESGHPVEVLGSVMDITNRRSNEIMLQEQNRVQLIINSVGEQLSQNLNSNRLVELLLSAGMDITGAQYGAYFSVVPNAAGEPSWKLEKLHGAPETAFTRLGNPSATNLFSRSFTTEEVVRSDDILADSRYGSNGGMPKGHLAVCSYLAVPVVGRNGHHGAILFGHNKPAMFTRAMEAMVVGVAHHAALAFDNAQLYRAAQDEISERKAAEERQQWLMGELNHRVKNILSVIQSIATQTVRTSEDLEGFKSAFINRLHGLSKSHELLTRADWSGADIKELLQLETSLFVEGAQQIKLNGPRAIIKPKAVVSLGMAIHELCTNATKYGALSSPTGIVDVRWYVQDERLYLHWIERGGPPVKPPSRKGFGSLLIHRVLTADMDGVVDMMYEPTGLVCHMDLDLR